MSRLKDNTPVIDQYIRDELLEPTQSFIVQAPAGSGKTELLTQRILALLAIVEKPENILAITFTKKAAAEMRGRVVSALEMGKQAEPEASHEKQRWRLARKVLERDQQYLWYLTENSSRLNITTIDSLSLSLTNALPLLSQTGILPKPEENAEPYYLKAAEALINSVKDDSEISQDILSLLKHKDNNVSLVTSLIAQMLSKRLQWMGSVSQHAKHFDQNQLLISLQKIISEKLQLVYQKFPSDVIAELPDLLNQAREVLSKKDKVNKPFILSLPELSSITKPTYQDLSVWKAIAELLLKAAPKPEFLSRFNVSNGFPLEKEGKDQLEKMQLKKNKQQVSKIVKDLSQYGGFEELLGQVRSLPDDIDQALMQEALTSVVKLLPIAVGHLKLIFKQYNIVDFPELAIASLDALGHPDSPSDLALSLDYRLEHILIDEFQDTSSPQIELIKMLTAGWDGSQQRSLFLVGDPMQSIYRFRDANVSLFMKIRELGIGQVKPTFRQLQVNFRSNQVVVDWVNQQFSRIMPQQEDLTFSAVGYASSVAFNEFSQDSQVNCFLTVDANEHFSQAEKIVSLVNEHLSDNLQRDKKQTLAILARGRNHLKEIIQLLNQNSIAYQAVDIDRLSQKILIKDITNLAFALCDLFDELSWVSCMRSPWFGLTLNDIRIVMTQSEANLSMPQRIANTIEFMSTESAQRCYKLLPLLNATIAYKGRKPFRKWIFGCFKALGGLHQLDFDSEHDDLMVCLDKLSELQEGGELNDRQLVIDAIEKLFAAPNPNADEQVQVMTIHKSKGLEFDTVILPRLDASKPVPDAALLKWTEVIDNQGYSHNLLAISKEVGQENDSIYRYIAYLDSEKSKYEDQRVLYVAVTRAKKKLYLLGNVNTDNKTGEIKKPSSGSYLNLLWEGIADSFDSISTQTVDRNTQHVGLYNSRLIKRVNIKRALEIPHENYFSDLSTNNGERLAHDENVSDNISLVSNQTSALKSNESESQVASYSDEVHDYFFEGATRVTSEMATAIGTVLHRQLQWISENYREGFVLSENWEAITESQLLSTYHFSKKDELNLAVEKVLLGVKNTLQDPFGRTLLNAKNNSASELMLHKKIEYGSFLTRIIDRTFIQNDIRWIVDYKSSMPELNESKEEFLNREKSLYLLQLTDYFKMFAKLEERKIVAGLYFPLLPHFETVIES